MLFGVGVSCRILYSIVSYLYVSCSGSITLVVEERTKFTCNYVVSVRRGFLFRLVLGMGCVTFIVALPGPSIQMYLVVLMNI